MSCDGLELVQFLDADAEELLGHGFDLLLVEFAFVDDPQDEALLALGAVPAVGRRSGSAGAVGWQPVARMTMAIPIAGMAVGG